MCGDFCKYPTRRGGWTGPSFPTVWLVTAILCRRCWPIWGHPSRRYHPRIFCGTRHRRGRSFSSRTRHRKNGVCAKASGSISAKFVRARRNCTICRPILPSSKTWPVSIQSWLPVMRRYARSGSSSRRRTTRRGYPISILQEGALYCPPSTALLARKCKALGCWNGATLLSGPRYRRIRFRSCGTSGCRAARPTVPDGAGLRRLEKSIGATLRWKGIGRRLTSRSRIRERLSWGTGRCRSAMGESPA